MVESGEEEEGVQHWIPVGSLGQWPGVEVFPEEAQEEAEMQVPATFPTLHELADGGGTDVQHCGNVRLMRIVGSCAKDKTYLDIIRVVRTVTWGSFLARGLAGGRGEAFARRISDLARV
ncbi:MAG: hypothetical protein M1837_002503 [Sclerophora amabilis]|nr:MAG: hypothetical protein M1837_002503 [Sclerophora amabilis]